MAIGQIILWIVIGQIILWIVIGQIIFRDILEK